MGGAWACLLSVLLGQGPELAIPKTVDSRLKLELFAESPQIVTPVGLAVDGQGRVFVVESHTHFPPPGYQGPKADRIQVLEDTNGDGRADRVTTFFEGLRATMNVALHPNGYLYVVTRSEVLRLKDADGDGRAEIRESLVNLVTPGNYPHNGLSGFAFDFAGNVYFGMGENLGADYRLVGADGRTLAGGGEGGNVYRCDAKGNQLERVATGFWNPFHLAFDVGGRLFTVDNDPDSRPPCRFIHIVPQGDYGYRFRNGRRGTHPFTAWNGELPGTLPMAGGTGEAPSGMLAYEATNLPAEYRGEFLVTSWGDHRLDRFTLRPRGASFVAPSTPIVVGGENFRPVGIVTAPDGSLFISDWVDKSYQLHGKGRVWRLSSKSVPPSSTLESPWGELVARDRGRREDAARQALSKGPEGITRLLDVFIQHAGADGESMRIRATALEGLATQRAKLSTDQLRLLAERCWADPVPEIRAMAVEWLGARAEVLALAERDPAAGVRAAALRRAGEFVDWPEVVTLLWRLQHDQDPFLRQAAASSLARAKLGELTALWDSRSAGAERVAVALMARHRDEKSGRILLARMLRDADPAVRFLAIQWIGEEALKEFRQELEETLRVRADSRLLFESCLAALERLDGVERKPTDEVPGEQYVVRLLIDEKTPLEVKRRALRTLRPEFPGLTLDLLRKQLASEDDALRLEAIRSLRDHPSGERIALLLELTGQAALSDSERAEAVMGLDAADEGHPGARKRLLELAATGEGLVALEALRGLRGVTLADGERAGLVRVAETKSPAWRSLWERVQKPRAMTPETMTTAYWLANLSGPADPQAGERIFFHPRATGCYRCHEHDGRGAGIGPELTRATRSLEKRRLVESLVEPSREVAPQFVPWSVETHSGEVFTGLLFAEEVDGTQRYIDGSTRIRRVKPAEIERRQPLEKSIMPDGLPHLLTEQEFRDLVAFLSQER